LLSLEGCGINRQTVGAPEEKMKKKAISRAICIGMFLTTVSMPSHAQDAAVHPCRKLSLKAEGQVFGKRERFLHRVKDLYFAAGCKVLANEAGILPLTSSESYLAFVGEQTIIDTKDELARREAAREGQEQAASGASASATDLARNPRIV
jgi:hypothetical protein